VLVSFLFVRRLTTYTSSDKKMEQVYKVICKLLNNVSHKNVFFDPLFLACHAIGNDLPVDRDELGSVPLNRTCGHSTSAWCQLGNRLRIVNGGSGQWKRLRSRMGHALDDDDDDDDDNDKNVTNGEETA